MAANRKRQLLAKPPSDLRAKQRSALLRENQLSKLECKRGKFVVRHLLYCARRMFFIIDRNSR
jgi:hypothetical protein